MIYYKVKNCIMIISNQYTSQRILHKICKFVLLWKNISFFNDFCLQIVYVIVRHIPWYFVRVTEIMKFKFELCQTTSIAIQAGLFILIWENSFNVNICW